MSHPLYDAMEADNPVGMWVPDDQDGTVVPDRTSNNNDATIYGATYVADAPFAGVGAMDFDGVDDYLSVGQPAVLNLTSALTLESWAKVDSLKQNFGPIVGKGDTQYMMRYYMGSSDNEWQFFVYTGSSWVRADSIPEDPPTAWRHVVATWDESTIRIYVDASEEGAEPVSSVASSSYDVEIGRNSQNTSRLFSGAIGPTAIYDHALSPARIQAHYDAAFGPAGPFFRTANGGIMRTASGIWRP